MRLSDAGAGRTKALLSLIFLIIVIFVGVKVIPVYVNDYQLDDYVRQQTPYWLTQRAPRWIPPFLGCLATIVLGRRVRPDPRVDLLVRRTTALRGAIFALVRTGAASMTGDPGGDWGLWEVELGCAGGAR